MEVYIEADGCGAAQAKLAGPAIAHSRAELVEPVWPGRISRRRSTGRNEHECVTAANEVVADAVIRERSAAVNASPYSVIVKLPGAFDVSCGAGTNLGNDGREATSPV